MCLFVEETIMAEWHVGVLAGIYQDLLRGRYSVPRLQQITVKVPNLNYKIQFLRMYENNIKMIQFWTISHFFQICLPKELSLLS